MAALNQHLETCIYTPLPVLPAESVSRTVPLEVLKLMAVEEEKARRTDELQVAFRERYQAEMRGDRAPEKFAGDLIDEMQRDVLVKFGFDRDDELALYELRTAAMQYPEEPVFQQSTFIKYNRCGDCAIADGDAIIDTELFLPDSLAPVTLKELVYKYAPPGPAALTDRAARRDPYGPIPEPRLETETAKGGGDDLAALGPLVIVTGSYT